MTHPWQPSTPTLDANTLRDVLRSNAVVAIHLWAPWDLHDRSLDEALRPLREDFAGRVAFHAVDVDHSASGEFVLEADVLNVPALGLWVRGRPWKTVTGVRTPDHLRAELEDAVRHSVSRPQNVEVYARDPDRERLLRWAEKILGRLTVVLDDRGSTVRHDPAGRAFTLTEGIEGTDFVGIWCASANDDLPFESDLDLARAVHEALGVEVRCDAGSMKPNSSPSEWWSVSGNGERLVEVWTPFDLDEGSFTSNFTSFGLTPRAGLFDQLVARYAESHRAYHTILHVCETHSALMDVGDRVQRWSEVEIALWFHDAIYDTRRHDNEERSADWARDELLAAGAAEDVAARVHALVLATKHRDVPEDNDARYLVDADLSILAAPPERFAAYERQIRMEYDWVAEPQFREARAKFLRGMLARPSIFSTAEMRDRHEAHARRNIEESLRGIGSTAR